MGRVGAILVAAGRSTRMGLDKIWMDLQVVPVVAWSLRVLVSQDRVVLVVARDRLEHARELVHQLGLAVTIVVGGDRRRDSVAAGVAVLDDCDWVLVHDGARPFLTAALVRRGLEAARETGAAIPAVPVRDTIKRVHDGIVVETLPRTELWAVQTPQVFRRDVLRAALASTDADVTDEAALVEALGTTVRVFDGDERNIKITTRHDLDLARALLQVWGPDGPR